jgi:ATP-dependent helicase/DNAse subunit B
MAVDKYKAVWVSHSSMGDFIRCPRAYYLHNVYKDPKTGKKISIVNGALSLGVAVHNTLEALSLNHIAVEERLKRDLYADFETEWIKISGKVGGFKDSEEEAAAKDRGKAMIERVIRNPGPISRMAVTLKDAPDGMPPNFYLSEEDNIILNGKVDWLEYIPEDDSIKVIDFKTGKYDENEDSLQLPIYLLLLNELQKRKVSGAAYWYLDRDDGYVEKKLPQAEEAREKVLAVARRVKEAREKKEFECLSGENGCFTCKPFEAILRGEAEYIGVGGHKKDMYMLP